MKKVLSVFLVVVLLLSMSVVAFADGDPNLIVKNATYNKTYSWYQLFVARTSGTGDNIAVTYHTTAAKKAVIEAMEDCPFEVDDVEIPGYGFGVTLKDDPNANVIDWLQAESAVDSTKKNFELLALDHGDMTYDNATAYATVDDGYYYITTTLGTEVTVDSVLGEDPVVVYDKNDAAPNGPDKLITKENEEEFSTGKTSNEAAVGSVEEFTITFNAVNFVNTTGDSCEKVLNWVIQDTPEGLAIIEDSIKVYVNDVLVILSPSAIDVDDNGKLTINIPWISTEAATYGDHLYSPLPEDETHDGIHIPVKIVYNATVLAEAATEPAPNAVVVSYGHVPAGTPEANTPNPNNPNDPENPVDPDHPWTPTDPENPWDPTDPDTPWDPEDPENPDNPPPVTPLNPDDDGDGNPDPKETVTYTYGFNLIKEGPEDHPLAGATFQLSNDAGLIYFLRTEEDGHYVFTVCPEGTTGATADIFMEANDGMDDDNVAYIRGLDLGEYTLAETAAPSGYNRCADMTITVRPESGEPTETQVLTRVDGESEILDLTVVNHTGSELPTTGGIGTTIFYVLGTILLLGAGIVLIARRKANER